MRRIFLDDISGKTVKITGNQHRHLSVVLRAKKGQALELTAGDGYIYSGIIKDITRQETIIEIIEKKADKSEPKITIDLFFGIIKGDHLEITVQKATELGVSSLIPMTSKNVVKKDINLERLNKITLEAAKQCGRGKVPKVSSPKEFSQVVGELSDYDLVVFPYEKASSVSLRQYLSGKEQVQKIAIIIGSEGGFTNEEAEILSKLTTPITLGKRILRADTASICTLAIVMNAFGQLE